MSPTSGAQPVYHGGDPPRIHPDQCPDLYALWGEVGTEPDAYGPVGYVVAMPDGRTYSIRAEADPWSLGLDGLGSHHSPQGAATFYDALLIRLTPDWSQN